MAGILSLMDYPPLPHPRAPDAAFLGQRVKLGAMVDLTLAYGIGPKAITSVHVREYKE